MSNSPSSIVRLVLFGGLFGLCPLLFSSQLAEPIRYPQLLGMMAVLLFAVVWLFREKGAEVVVKIPKRLALLFAVWLGLHLLSIAWARNVPEAMFASLQVGAMLVLLLVLLHFFQKKDAWDELAKVMVVAGALQACYGLLQEVGIDPLGISLEGVPVGTHGNPNHLGSAGMLMLPLVIWAVLHLGKGWKVAGLASAILLLAMMYHAGSRAVWLSLVLWAVITPIWGLPLLWRKGNKALFWTATLATLCLVSLAWLGWRTVGGKKAASMHFEYLIAEDVQIRPEYNSLEFRYVIWNRSMDMIADHPLLGVGAGNWKVAIPRYGIKGFDDEGRYGMDYAMRAHNDFLQAGGELGLAGLLALLGLYGGGLGMAIVLSRKREKEEERIKGFLLLLAFTGLVVEAFFSFPGERVFQSMMFWTYLAMATSLWGERATGHRTLPASWKYVAALVLAFGLVFTGYRMKGDAAMRRMMVAKAQKKWLLAEKEALKASNWTINIEPISGAPPEWYAGLAQLTTGRNAEGLVNMQRALSIAPWHLAVRTNLAAAYEMNGQHLQAADEYERLLKTFPDFEESWLNLAVVYLHLGEFARSREALAKVGSFQADPRYPAILAELERLGQ